jgi:hypothetical protein
VKVNNRSLKIFLLLGILLFPFDNLLAQTDSVGLPTGIYQEKEGSNFTVIDKKGDTLHLDPNAVCDISDFEGVSSIIGPLTGKPGLEIRLTDNGKYKFYAASKANLAKKIAILAQGKLLSAPIVQTIINTNNISVSGFESMAEAEKIKSALLKEIKLKTSNKIVHQVASDTIIVMSASLSFLNALISRDTLTLDSLLATEAHFETYFGKGLDKQSLLLYLKTVLLKYSGYSGDGNFSTENVVQEGNSIRLNKIINVEGIYKGGEFKAQINIWEVWVKENNKWRLFLRTARKIE